MLTTQYLLEAFRGEGITHVFLVPGGLIDPFLPALASTPGITPVVAGHEGGAASMADGYARAGGRFGVCFAIGGPGVTNMVTAVAAARTDFSPVIVISGQVPTNWEGRGGFQDSSPAALNDVAVFHPITISSLMVENLHLVHHHLRASLTKMLAGSQGPAHISLPTDIQKDEVQTPWVKLDETLYAPRFVDRHGIERLWRLLAPSDNSPAPIRILALVGAGVEKSGGTEDLVAFAERFEIPVATTLRAKGVFPEDHRLSLGIFGYAGHRYAIDTILSDDVEILLVLGSGLSQRDTLFWDRRMLPSRALVQVDIDPQVIGRTWPVDVPVVGDCGRTLQVLMSYDYQLAQALESANPQRRTWLERIRAAGPRHYEGENTTSAAVPLHPARVITELRRVMPRDTVLVVDSGAHRAFCGHYWEAYEPRSYISATNLGPMGWAIPAGIGAKAARPDRPLVVVTGGRLHVDARHGDPDCGPLRHRGNFCGDQQRRPGQCLASGRQGRPRPGGAHRNPGARLGGGGPGPGPAGRHGASARGTGACLRGGPEGRRPIPGGRPLRPGLHHAGDALHPGPARVG